MAGWLRHRGSATRSAAYGRLPHAGDPRCRTWRRNAHRTGEAEDREVLYPWHPWSGCVVHVHEAVVKEAGEVLRCSLEGGDAGRWLELPAWMLDRASCAVMRIEGHPCVDVGTLWRLTAVLATSPVVVSPASASLPAPVSSAGWTSCNPNRGGIHATPAPSAPSRSSSDRSLQPPACVASGNNAELAAVTGGGPRGGDAPDRPPAARTRKQRSPVRVDRRAR